MRFYVWFWESHIFYIEEEIIVKCPKCGSDNVNVQTVAHVKSKGKGCLYWLLIGWWFEFFMWLFFTIPMIIVKIFGRKKTQTKMKTYAVCQHCGHTWKA